MSVKVGINGFGRIGSLAFRAAVENDNVEVVGINDPFIALDYMGYMLKFDTVHGRFKGTIDVQGDKLVVNGKSISVYSCMNAADIPWTECGAEYILECSGINTTVERASEHLKAGAKKVVITCPAKGEDATIVMGVNDDIYDAAAHTVLSAASCTTNCLAPVAKVLNDAFGIRHGLMTTIHSYTMSQRILDGSHKDLRRARAACVSMIPTSTGAAKALALVVPALKGKLDGMAVRVPTPDISLVDLTCELEKPATAEEINAALKAAHDGALHDNMGYCDEPLVSIDFKGSTHGGVVDALSTQVLDGTMAKLIIWYDNESGFTNQLARLLRKVAASL